MVASGPHHDATGNQEMATEAEPNSAKFEQEKWATEVRFRERELAAKERELARSKWSNPLVLAIIGATVAALVNIYVSGMNDHSLRAIESQRADATQKLEQEKAEAARILEVIKTGDTKSAIRNLKFLVDTGLITHSDLVTNIQTYLENNPDQGPVLPPATAQIGPLAFCDRVGIDPDASRPLRQVSLPPQKKCELRTSNGFPLPDPDCTPGATNPHLTLPVLKNKGFTTLCTRDLASSVEEKMAVYRWYDTKRPKNSGARQTCELDHLIPLELGGADTLDNVWPQCGTDNFRTKDTVENYLNREVKSGRMSLADAQRGIAVDWTQFIARARSAAVEPENR